MNLKYEVINIFVKNKIIFDNLMNKISYMDSFKINFILINDLNDFKYNQNQINIFFIPADYNELQCERVKKIINQLDLSKTIICTNQNIKNFFSNYKNLLDLPVFFSQLEKKINTIKLLVNIKFKNLELNKSKNVLINTTNKLKVTLTQIESNIASLLMMVQGKVSREEINLKALGYAKNINSHSLDSHIYRLRKKLIKISKNNQIVVKDSGFYKII